MTRVFLCDDAPEVRYLFRCWLEDAGLEVVGEASSCPECVRALEHADCDVALVDLSRPPSEGLAAVRAICERRPDIALIVASGHSAGEMEQPALVAGAKAYIEKDTDAKRLVAAVELAAA